MRKFIRRALRSIDRLDRKRLNALVHELVEENDQLEMILSSIPGGVVVIGHNHRILMLNRPARRLLPLDMPDPMDRKVWEVISSSELSNYIREALEGDRGAPMKDFPMYYRAINRILSCGILTLVNEGSIKGSMLYVEDVTEFREEQARLKRAEGLASLTTMAAGVAHEIKNPLASMSIHLQLMRRRLEGNCINPEDFQDTLEILEEETERLNNIVSDYLFAVRPKKSQLHLANINAIFRDLVQFLHFELEEGGVSIVQILDDTVPFIPLDEGAMKRALLNLIKNALAAMPDGGSLTLETALERDSISIAITDTGYGISEELQGKIFEPYFTTRDAGSGLGLTVVYKVVKEHGGDLQMDSAVGEGTCFRIILPIPQKKHRLLSGGER